MLDIESSGETRPGRVQTRSDATLCAGCGRAITVVRPHQRTARPPVERPAGGRAGSGMRRAGLRCSRGSCRTTRGGRSEGSPIGW